MCVVAAANLDPRRLCETTKRFPSAPAVALFLGAHLFAGALAAEAIASSRGSTGSIRGRVTEAGTGIPLKFASVYASIGDESALALTDSLGEYVITDLPAGSYTVGANVGGHLFEFYDDHPCHWFRCDPATPVVVAEGAQVTGIDFELERGGRLSGTVTDRSTHLPLGNIMVQPYAVLTEPGSREPLALPNDMTDAQGRYSLGGDFPSGRYYVRTESDRPHLNGALGGEICFPSSKPCWGSPIEIVAGKETSGADLELVLGGWISGRIHETGSEVPLVAGHTIYDAVTGEPVAGGSSHTQTFRSDGLATGTYRLVGGSAGYVPELYGYGQCVGDCPPAEGTILEVTIGQETAGIELSLERGGLIGGIQHSPNTYGGCVEIFDHTGRWASWGCRTRDPGYLSDDHRALPTGTYFARAWDEGQVTQLYRNRRCAACDPTGGTPIAVVAGETTWGIDFDMKPGGRISGQVFDQSSGYPIPEPICLENAVEIYDEKGRWVSSGERNCGDGYRSVSGLPTGKYFVVGDAKGYRARLRPDLPCPFGACDPTIGESAKVVLLAETTGIDLSLPPAPIAEDGFESGGFGAWSGGTMSIACAHSLCETGVGLDAACDPCVAAILGARPTCSASWSCDCVVETFTTCRLSSCEWE